jgi:hypothetical protein
MEREELEQIYSKTSYEDRLYQYLGAHEAFEAIQDEALHFLVSSDNLSEEVREILNRIEALARHRHDFRTEAERDTAKSPEFRKSAKILAPFLKKLNKTRE